VGSWWIVRLFKSLVHWWQGKLRNIELADKASTVRSEAEEAVSMVIYATGVAPDCVSASVIQGGFAILIQSDENTKETFVHNSYTQAAEKAIEWWHERGGKEICQGTASKMNRAERRAFNRQRQRRRNERH
jgi:hypothetical protein